MKRKLTVFVVIVLVVGALMLLTWWAVLTPPCEDPPNSWAPCLEFGR